MSTDLLAAKSQSEEQAQQLPQNQLDTSLNDQTNSVSVLLSTCTVFQSLTQTMKENKGNLKELISLTPNSCKEDCKDKRDTNEAYQKFSQSVVVVDKAYSSIPNFVFKFKRFLQLVSHLIKQITATVRSRIENNQNIDSQEIYDLYKKQLEDAQSQYDNLIEYREKFERELEENDVVQAKSSIQNATKLIFQLQFSEKSRDSYEEVSEMISQLKIDLGKLSSEKELKKSQLLLAEQNKKELEKQLIDMEAKKKETQKKHDLQINEIEEQGKKKNLNNRDLIEILQNQIKELQAKKQQSAAESTQQAHNLTKFAEKAFQQSQEQISNLSLGSRNTTNITILDESGSMSGAIFNECVKAIQQMVVNQKKSNPDDEFCLIQFDDEARITMNLKKFSNVDEKEIGKKFRGGGTNFQKGFQTAIDVIPLCSQNNHINIVFFTDGCDGNSRYEDTLKQLKRECGNRQVTLFCLGYGNGIDVNHLKRCLTTLNGQSLSKKLLDGKSVQTLYQVNSIDDILEAFQKVSDQTMLSSQELKEKANLKAESQKEYLENFSNLSKGIISGYDQNIEQLNDQIKNLYKQNTKTDIETYKEEIRNIQQKEIAQICQLIDSIRSQKETIDTKIQEKNKEAYSLEEDIKIKTSLIEQKQKLYLVTPNQEGGNATSDKIIEDLKKITQKAEELGFINKQHFDEFYCKLESAEIMSKNIQQFKNNIFLCIDKINNLLQTVVQSIKVMSDDSQKRLEDTNNYFKINIINFLNANTTTSKEYKKLETYEVLLDFLKLSDKGLSLIIDNDQNLKNLTDEVIQNLQNLQEISLLTNNVIEERQKKGEPKKTTVRQYIDKIFFKIFKTTEIEYIDPKIQQLQEQITQIEEQIDDEEDEKKLAKLQTKKERLEQKLETLEEKQEEKLDKLKEKQENKLKEEKDTEYKHIERIINYLHSSLLLLEYSLRQQQIFTPMLIMRDNLTDLEGTNKTIQQLSITY